MFHIQGGRALEHNRQIIAAHYFYLLKEDSDSLRKLWKQLTASTGPDGDSTVPAALPALAADPTAHSERCVIMHSTSSGEIDFCLAMLPNLAVIEVLWLKGAGDHEQGWRDFLSFIDGQRAQAQSGGITLFGETVLMVAAPDEEADYEHDACALIGDRLNPSDALALPGLGEPSEPVPAPSCRHLVSDLAPELCGGGNPRLTQLPGPNDSSADYFVLRANSPERMLSTIFPELDSLLKELARAAAYFREQRDAIVEENSSIDKQVGALLHRQVVSMDVTNPDTVKLESRIAELSRMFGLLATDSLVTRQADKRLAKDLGALRRVLGRMMDPAPGKVDGVGDYHLELFGTEVEAIRTVNRDLDHSRQNAEAAIDVVRTRIELVRAEEGSQIQSQTRGLLDQMLKLQEEATALQVAAGLIEFVLIFYYVLISWEHLLGLERAEHISPVMRILPVFGIAAGAALGTHFMARSIKNKTWRNPGMWISAVMMIAALAGMIMLSLSV